MSRHLLAAPALLAVLAAGPPPASDPVRDLASPDYRTRERATAELWARGEAARPALEAALASPDPEVAGRAGRILDRFDEGDAPGTPPAVRELIQRYRAADPGDLRARAGALIDHGPAGRAALRSLLARSPAPDVAYAAYLSRYARHRAAEALVAGDAGLAEEHLILNTYLSHPPGLADYGMILERRGTAAVAAAGLEARVAAGGASAGPARWALPFAYRAAGDMPKALAAARAAESAAVPLSGAVDQLLEHAGDWQALAARLVLPPVNSVEGLRAFRLRLAGDEAGAAVILDGVREAAGELATGGVDAPTLALFLNDRPADAVARMKVRHVGLPVLADVLTARHEFAAALELLPADAAPDALAKRGRVLAQTGRRTEARAAFAAAVAGPTAQPREDDGRPGFRPNESVIQLVKAEVRAGFLDLAVEHYGRALAGYALDHKSASLDAFEALFGGQADTAITLWRALQPAATLPPATPPVDGVALLGRVRRLVAGTATAAERATAFEALAAQQGSVDVLASPWPSLAVAHLHDAGGRPDLALVALEAAADRSAGRAGVLDDPENVTPEGVRSRLFSTDERFVFWTELGDRLVSAGRPADAAKRLFDGWQQRPTNPILLYLSGHALLQAGDAAGGRRRVDLAHAVAFGNAQMRGRFLDELNARGHVRAADRERLLARAAAWYPAGFVGNVWVQTAVAGTLAGDHAAAAADGRRSLHYVLRYPGARFVSGEAHLFSPLGVRAEAARALLKQGKLAEGVAAARACLAAVPGGGESAASFVSDLDNLGRTADADALFRTAWDAYASVVRDHPDTGWARGMAAQLAAGGRRELTAGLAYAKKAVELEPDVPGHREALAEVHFRRGEREQAVAVMAKLAAGDRRKFAYQRKLAHYRTGDPRDPLPPAD